MSFSTFVSICILLCSSCLVSALSFPPFSLSKQSQSYREKAHPKNVSLRLSSSKNKNDESENGLKEAIVPMKLVIDNTFKEGKSINWGVFQKDVNQSEVPSTEERLIRKKEATKNLTNIDEEGEYLKKEDFLILSFGILSFIF